MSLELRAPLGTLGLTTLAEHYLLGGAAAHARTSPCRSCTPLPIHSNAATDTEGDDVC